MRLIDADKLRKIFEDREYHCALRDMLLEFVDVQPTAFDVDEVIGQLEGLKSAEQDDSVAEIVSTRIWNKAIQKSIVIVKGGGI